jgi:hypothetical protein
MAARVATKSDEAFVETAYVGHPLKHLSPGPIRVQSAFELHDLSRAPSAE